MGRLAERLDALRVNARSPDQRIFAELLGQRNIRVWFADEESYYSYRTETQLASQLSALIGALLDGRRQGQHAAIRDVTDLVVDEVPHWDDGVRTFRSERDKLIAVGLSEREYITVTSTGLVDAEVSITSGAFEDLEEPAFLAELQSALSDMWMEHGSQLQDLKRKHLGVLDSRSFGDGRALRRR